MPTPLWKPGQSGNPKGRPKADFDLPAVCRSLVPEAVDVVTDILRNSEDERMRFAAASWLTDRGYGKAPLTISSESGQSLTILHLIAAKDVSDQLAALTHDKAPQHPQIEGAAEPVSTPVDISAPALE